MKMLHKFTIYSSFVQLIFFGIFVVLSNGLELQAQIPEVYQLNKRSKERELKLPMRQVNFVSKSILN